ncbi:MAG: NADH-quinone oxidoreductase subunit C [Sphingobacteriales bacterium]|jgi:NADH-quinone oxidoreductase subunit C|nr:NADH-quinone oxidoreductase subunit C [Sphingobacteriales bacterium]MBP9141733.1 NADH-quinone oxidoreductase subunit C [Chitinophagales bacterium]MDA0199487.1 NADH-quinone oxidoreductase subunit C [Bacteroidota bacterium]MBK6889410.1 NADH-quinone oxidoreductase subunit C [Sphingobacteriales bacterium]MBK7528090.1 NADH-quinone oxidoreductase subunit C [Sphingobacteriales bacterium]
MPLDNQHVLDRIRQQHPNAVHEFDDPYGLLTLEIAHPNIMAVLQFLRDDAEFQMIYLTDLCGLHYPNNSGKELGVVYHLHSLTHNFRLRLKTFFPVKNPHTPTATKLWPAANWMERETYDFFGIHFDGHPDLRRILNVDEMDYFPLRKEYPLEDGTRTDKDDRFFGRDGHVGIEFDDIKSLT